MPLLNEACSNPKEDINAVIKTRCNLNFAPSLIALTKFVPSLRSCQNLLTKTTPYCVATPNKAMNSKPAEILKFIPVKYMANKTQTRANVTFNRTKTASYLLPKATNSYEENQQNTDRNQNHQNFQLVLDFQISCSILFRKLCQINPCSVPISLTEPIKRLFMTQAEVIL